MSILGLGRATFKEMVIDPQKVESFPYGLADEIIDGFRMLVEGRNRRKEERDSQIGSTIMQAFIDHEVIISSISVLLRRPCQKFPDLSP